MELDKNIWYDGVLKVFLPQRRSPLTSEGGKQRTQRENGSNSSPCVLCVNSLRSLRLMFLAFKAVSQRK